MSTIKQSTELTRVKGNRLREVLVLSLFNLQGVDAFSLAIGHEDTTFEYLILTEQRLNKTKLAEVKAFAQGVECAFKSF